MCSSAHGQTTSRIGDLLRTGTPSVSFEFFPPHDETGERALWETIESLAELNPTFVSVTYGAGGHTRERTVSIARRIARETSLLPMAHLTCVGHTANELRSIVGDIRDAGIGNIMVLRGDPPAGPGTPWPTTPGGLEHAIELVELIRAEDPAMSVGVAAFPCGHRDAPDLATDTRVLRAKLDAGAEFAVTEMVLRVADYQALLDRAGAAGVDAPLVPGIMPIVTLASMRRMVQLSGQVVPSEIEARLLPLSDDPSALRAEGVRIATELCAGLLAAGAPGLHFYTLNRARSTQEILAALHLARH